MDRRLPFDTTGLTVAALVGGGVLAVFVFGQVLRFLSRMVAWASFVLIAVLAAYVAYELYTGWTSAKGGVRSGRSSIEADTDGDSISSLQSEYTAGSLSEAELERELDRLLEDRGHNSSEQSDEQVLDREL